MADKRFRGRDKIVQKRTKDGLVEENLRTGETKSAVAEEPPKQEDSEKDAAESAEETPVVEEDVCMNAEDGEEEKPRRSTAKQSTEYYKAHQEDGKPKEKDVPPVDEDTEPAPKKKGRLSFDDEQQGGIVRGAGLGIKKVAKKGVDTATGFAHNKVHQVEKENSGVESAHKSEETLEGLYRFFKGRKKTREKSARAEKKVEVEKKSSRLKFSESEGGMAEEVAETSLKKKTHLPPPTAAGGEATKTVGSKFYQKKQYKDAYAAVKRGQKAGNAASKQAATAANTLQPYREQARTLMDALSEKDVERTAVYRKYERCEMEQEQLEDFESRYQAEIEELEAEFKNIMMKVSVIEQAFSYVNPWLTKFQDLTTPEILERTHIKKYVERVWIDDFKRVEVVLKEEEWTRFFPEEWMRTRKEN